MARLSTAGMVTAQRRERVLVIALFAGAAAISGFTLLRGIEPFDEGLTVLAGERIAAGQVPYRDFLLVYGPAQPYLLGALSDLLGSSLLWWRLVRVAIDAATAVTVFTIVGRTAGRRWALAAWLAAAVTMAQPTGPTPFPAPLLLGLIAVAMVARPTLSSYTPYVAGALAGLASAWRLDFGVFAGAAILATIATGGAGARVRVEAAGRAVAAGLATGLLVYIPFAILASPATVLDSVIGLGVRGRQSLPFPLAFDGTFDGGSPRDLLESAKDVLGFYVPALCVAGVAIASASAIQGSRGRRAAPPSLAGLAALAAGSLVYLLSRPDEFHAQPLALVLTCALPVAYTTLGSRLARTAAAVVFALLLVAGLANRGSALLAPPDLERVDVAVADGVKAPPSEARSIARAVEAVQARVPPGESIYVATRRADLIRINNPMFYVLAQRGNLHRRDYGPITDARGQRAIVRDLRVARPRVVVRWLATESVIREPNESGRPTGARLLDRYLAERFDLAERHGDYEILVPDGSR